MGCFAGEIITRDLASNRWLDRASGNALLLSQINPVLIKRNDEIFIGNFIKEHGIHPYHNDSRKRSEWLKIPSLLSWLHEIKYIIIHYFLLVAKSGRSLKIYKLKRN